MVTTLVVLGLVGVLGLSIKFALESHEQSLKPALQECKKACKKKVVRKKVKRK